MNSAPMKTEKAIAVDPALEWLMRAAGILEGNPKLAQPHVLKVWRWARLEAGQWTAADMAEAQAAMGHYMEILRARGLRGRPPVGLNARALATGAGVVPVTPVEGLAVSLWGVFFAVRFPYGHDATAAVRAIDGATWNREARAWLVGPTEANAEAVEGLRAHGFSLDEQAEAAIAAVREHAEETRAASRAAAGTFTVEGFAGDLRPYQQAGVKYLVDAKRAFLADDMGLGKTRQALATVQALGAWPALVVTLASCKGGWERECGRVLPGVRVKVWEGRGGNEPFDDGGVEARGGTVSRARTATRDTQADGARDQRAVTRPATCPETGRHQTSLASVARCSSSATPVLHIINYDLLAPRLEELCALGVKAVVFDEIHHLKNGKSKRTAAAKRVVRRVPVRLGLSGTPVLNAPQELLSQLHVLGRLKDVGGFWKFGLRYCGARQTRHGWDFTGAQNLGELHTRLRGICYLRRTKAQVMPELPPRVTTRVPIGMTAEGWVRYRAAAKDLLGWLGEKAASAPGFIERIAGLPEEQRDAARAQMIQQTIERMEGMELLRRLQELRQVAADGKLERAKEWVRELCPPAVDGWPARKLVLFGHHRKVMKALHETFRGELGAILIDGDTPSGRRQALVDAFQKGGTRLALLNLMAGGTGLDGLQHAAADVAFLEWPWTPAGLEQAISRLERSGQKMPVHVWHLTAPGTVDDEILTLLETKAEICDAVNDGVETARQAAIANAREVARRMVVGGTTL